MTGTSAGCGSSLRGRHDRGNLPMDAAGNPPQGIVEKPIDSIPGITAYATAIQHEFKLYPTGSHPTGYRLHPTGF